MAIIKIMRITRKIQKGRKRSEEEQQDGACIQARNTLC
jgi:hypothetical protein